MGRNIFIVGTDPFNMTEMNGLKKSSSYHYYSLIGTRDIKCVDRFDVLSFLKRYHHRLAGFQESVDAIVGYWDFPVSTILPVLRKSLGLPGPTLEAVLGCEHKYLGRVLQKEVVGEMVPDFCAVDPFSPHPDCKLDFPFWIKPVKSVCSHLGFRIGSREDFETSLGIIRKNIYRFAQPFNIFMDMAGLPPSIHKVDGNHCIAESLISQGRQCTLEGYVLDGIVRVYGTVDSIRDDDHPSCFTRYQYPSALPREVLERMEAATARVMTHVGYMDSPFNIEFYWNETDDAIRLLEINTRISKSHCPLFRLVDGESNHAVMIDVALGEEPGFPHRQGAFSLAAKFMLRSFENGVVRRVPGPEDVQKLKRRFPEAQLLIQVRPGQILSSLREQDSYSYEFAVLYLGADSQEELVHKYREARSVLPFVIETRGGGHAYCP
ncbi:ATP-grasp domain-containing protein [Desulfoplanes sp.]